TLSGGKHIIILCVRTERCEWPLHSLESEVATVWRNAPDRVRKLWQPEEPTDDGWLVRCSLVQCRRLPLESHRSEMRLECHVARCLVKVLAEELGWSLAAGSEGLSGLPHDKKPARGGSVKDRSIYPPCPMGVPVVCPAAGEWGLLSHKRA